MSVKKLYWWIAGAVFVGVVMGASVAIGIRTTSGNSQPQLSAISQSQGDRPDPELTDPRSTDLCGGAGETQLLRIQGGDWKALSRECKYNQNKH